MLNVNYAKGMTTTEMVEDAQKKHLDVITTLIEETESDGDRKSSDVIDMYVKATEEERMIMDALLINICGWSMGSIIKMSIERNNIDSDYDEDDEETNN